MENRPELKAEPRLNARIRENAWKKTKRDYFPTVSAFESLDWDSDVSSDFERSYFAGAVAESEISPASAAAPQADSAKANYEVATAEERKAHDNLKLDLAPGQPSVEGILGAARRRAPLRSPPPRRPSHHP